jgi:glycosyltransferase involved in cell wall biosynthesis
MKQIVDSYLLSVCVPIKVDSAGVRWCDELWAKDLSFHLDYISELTIACPRVFAEAGASDVPLNVSPFNRLKFVELPSPQTRLQAISALPMTVAKMWTAARRSKLVHTGFGGWPIPEGWIAVPIAWLQRRFLIINVESSPWRVDPRANSFRRGRAKLVEFANRLCISVADLRFFTSSAYRNELLGSKADRAYVVPATWIDQQVILTEDDAESEWSRKSSEVRFIFVGRLTRAKGLSVLIEALEKMGNLRGFSFAILGEGPMNADCDHLSHRTDMKISMLGQVRYGPEFFSLLRKFDAVVVPSISDEQPRIIFDAFSQAVPIIGSDTGGIGQVVDHKENGILFPKGSASELERWLRWAVDHRSDLRRMGLAALSKSRHFTHRSMHDVRSVVIAEEIARRARN